MARAFRCFHGGVGVVFCLTLAKEEGQQGKADTPGGSPSSSQRSTFSTVWAWPFRMSSCTCRAKEQAKSPAKSRVSEQGGASYCRREATVALKLHGVHMCAPVRCMFVSTLASYLDRRLSCPGRPPW